MLRHFYDLFADFQVFLVDKGPDLVLELEETRAHLGLLITWVGNVYVYDALTRPGRADMTMTF